MKKLSKGILRNTDTLFKDATLGHILPSGIRVSLGSTSRHPSGGGSVAQIGAFQQRGTKYAPAREILVPPDESLLTDMRNVVYDAI